MLGSVRVFDYDDLVDLLRSRVKSAGGQSAFARHEWSPAAYCGATLPVLAADIDFRQRRVELLEPGGIGGERTASVGDGCGGFVALA